MIRVRLCDIAPRGFLRCAARKQFRLGAYRGPTPAGGSGRRLAESSALVSHVPSVDINVAAFADRLRKMQPAVSSPLPASGHVSTSPSQPWDVAVRVVDKSNNPIDVTGQALEQWEDLEDVLPVALQKTLSAYRGRKSITTPTSMQRIVLSLAYSQRDVLCIAPTGSGKTLAYLIPALSLIETQQATEAVGLKSDDDGLRGSGRLNRVVGAAKKMRDAPKCKYCGLDMLQAKICPETGAMHPQLRLRPEIGDASRKNSGTTAWKDDLHGTAKCFPTVLVLVPSTMLCQQVYAVAAALAPPGVRVGYILRTRDTHTEAEMMRALEGCDLLVAVPGQLAPAVEKMVVSLGSLRTVVLDEVDELFQFHQYEPVTMILKKIVKFGPRRPQRMFFGATLPPSCRKLLDDLPLLHENCAIVSSEAVDHTVTRNSSLKHNVYMITPQEKVSQLLQLYRSQVILPAHRTMVFCNSLETVGWLDLQVCAALEEEFGVRLMKAHRRLADASRQRVFDSFNAGACTLLVCTDICARGLDFNSVVHVVNYDLPLHFTQYIHRAGRCGRRGQAGFVHSFFVPGDHHLAGRLSGLLRAQHQLVPAKLDQYARESLNAVLQNSVVPLNALPSSGRYGRKSYVKNPLGSLLSEYPDAKVIQNFQKRPPES